MKPLLKATMSGLVHGGDAAVDPLEVDPLAQELRGVVPQLEPPAERVRVVVVVRDVRPLMDDRDQGGVPGPAAGVLAPTEDHAVHSGLETQLHHLLGQKRLRDLHRIVSHVVSLFGHCTTGKSWAHDGRSMASARCQAHWALDGALAIKCPGR